MTLAICKTNPILEDGREQSYWRRLEKYSDPVKITVVYSPKLMIAEEAKIGSTCLSEEFIHHIYLILPAMPALGPNI